MFNVKVKLSFVYFDESSYSFYIYLDEKGNIPEISIKEKIDINYLIEQKCDEIFGSWNLLSNYYLSNIEYGNDTIVIPYNIYCPNENPCKTGKFVKFDKPSMELYRFAKHRGV